MQETTGPDIAPLPASAHLLEPILRRVREEPNRPMLAYRRGDAFVDMTVADCYAEVRAIAKGLIASDVQAGDRVVIMSHTRYEWMLTDYAILSIGAVTVPIYETSSAEQVQWIVSDSGAVLCIMETPAMRALLDEARGTAPGCRESLVIDDGGLDVLIGRGADVPDEALDERLAGVTTDNLASIVYTSGTTGLPKGCVITHGNLRVNVLQNIEAVRSMLGPEEASLVFLPLAHVLSKIITLVGMEWGVKGVFASDIANLPEELATSRPTMIVAVPRVFEKVFNGARHKAVGEGHGRIFDRSEQIAIQWSEQGAAGGRSLLVDLQHRLFDRLVYRKLRDVFGGRMRFAFSGGGPLGERLTHYFNGIGVRIFEGYGLTETSPTLTLNSAEAWEPGTVGRPLGGTTIRIAEDGEILAKGPQVFQGYWHNQAATDEAIDHDGWFHTGDIGDLDGEGYLRITGRKKDLIVTAAGKNVAPAPLEDRLRAHPLISQAVVVGDQLPFVAAVLALDEEAVQEWAADRGMHDVVTTELHSNPELLSELQLAVDDANRSVSKAESIRKFAVLPRDLSIEAGELTPTLKVRRALVAKSYASIIDELYDS